MQYTCTTSTKSSMKERHRVLHSGYALVRWDGEDKWESQCR